MTTTLPLPAPRTQSYLAFARIPDPASVLSHGAYKLLGIIDRFHRQGNDSPKDDELGRDLGCSRGQIQRYLSELKETPIPGQEDERFLEIRHHRGQRTMRLSYVLKPPAKRPVSPPRKASFFRAPDMHPISAGATCNQRQRYMHADSHPLLGFRELENVNVNVSSTSKIQSTEEAPNVALPIESQPTSPPRPSPAEADPVPDAGRGDRPSATHAPVVASDPNDGVDPALAGLTDEELTALIDRLANARGIEAKMERLMAKTLLAARQAASRVDAPLTPKVPPLVPPTPRPTISVPTPPKPPAPTPRPSIWAMADRLARGVAGPGPIEEFARFLAEEFRDEGSVPFYRKIAARVRSGELHPSLVSRAYRQAKSDGVRSPGSVFNAVVRQLE